ncbi:MAG: hypothetical protein PHW31_03200 [Candidatus Pacebacteria bacterium]|nr:hypothetical protein [Candidatus Paceibacterota bacterium]
MFKYGLKIWNTNQNWFNEAVLLFEKGIIDFAEIYLVPDSFSLADFEIFKKKNVPVNLHAPHTTHNFDVFSLDEKSLDIWHNQVLKTADYLQSQFIVVHPGVGNSKKIFLQESRKIKDPRVLMESMVKIGFVGVKEGGVICFGYSKEELEFIKECGFEICLDVSHSLASAVWQKIDPYTFISGLIKILNPFYFHLSGGFLNRGIDEHLDIWEGDFDFAWLKKELAPLAKAQDIYLVFETPKIGKGLENDVKNIKYFKNLLSF